MGHIKKDHARRPTWLVMRRCLTIIHRLMRSPATREELLQIIYDDAIRTDEELKPSEAKKRFEQDRERLRSDFDVELEYNRQSDRYSLIHIGKPLIDLPDTAISALAFLQQNFNHDSVPMQNEIQSLLEMIIMVLPTITRKRLEKERGLLEMELGVKDTDDISDEIWQSIKTSISERRQLEFVYLAGSNTDGLPRTHLVEPIRYYFDSTWRHYYLDAFGIGSRSHVAHVDQKYKVFPFRIGRIVSATVLPKRFVSNRRIPTTELIYELTPEVARLGVTQHFPKMNIVQNPDGSARVHVWSENLFFDLRRLLHYGDNCKVIGGEDAVNEMQKLVKRLYKRYYHEDNLL